MKKLLLAVFLLSFAASAHAATWYATAATPTTATNINTTGTWVPTSTGACTGSGTALVWGAQANGDVFDANGCTALAVNVDPGVATGASAGVCGATTVEVTLQSNATNAGTFTYATATNIVVHTNITIATAENVAGSGLFSISGSTGGGTICGNVLSNPTYNSEYGIIDNHTSVTIYMVGNLTGGSTSGNQNDTAYWLQTSGPVTIIGNTIAGTAGSGFGVSTSTSPVITMTGNAIGSNTGTYSSIYIYTGTPTLTLTGNIINGLKEAGVSWTGGTFIYTPTATNYILYPKDSSYTLNTINSHSTLVVPDPGVANVKSGVAYGPNTGTYSGGGGAASNGYAY